MSTGSLRASGKPMKGQFFIIGALIICVLIFFGLPLGIDLVTTGSDDLSGIAGNLETEFPHALNTGINRTAPVATLHNFSLASKDYCLARMADFRTLWVVFEYDNGDFNVTAGNFFGESKTVTVNISGDVRDITVPQGSENSTLFSTAGSRFSTGVSLDGDTTEFVLVANKTSFFCTLSLGRGGDIVKKQILA